jgi:hypothetical protein
VKHTWIIPQQNHSRQSLLRHELATGPEKCSCPSGWPKAEGRNDYQWHFQIQAELDRRLEGYLCSCSLCTPKQPYLVSIGAGKTEESMMKLHVRGHSPATGSNASSLSLLRSILRRRCIRRTKNHRLGKHAMNRPARAIVASGDRAIAVAEEWQYERWEGYSEKDIMSRCIFWYLYSHTHYEHSNRNSKDPIRSILGLS